jgi:N-acetylglucosaminyldiphosphoundecaprenol N-acetyl-beta-D-mannosaminyltransferase
MVKKASKKAQILGINVDSTSLEQLLVAVRTRIENNHKTLIVTPNPEFIVYAKDHLWFKKLINRAHFAIPDGFGLVLASRFLGQPLKGRVTGSDLVVELLKIAQKEGWSVGLIGSREAVGEEEGVIKKERQRLVAVLQKKYPRAKIFALEDHPGWQQQKFQLIFACQGMGKQEKWIFEHYRPTKGLVFVGIGGSLDFLTGFAKRAPRWWRQLGLEWLWRGFSRPAHFRRIWVAVFKFSLLVLRSKIR